MPHLQGSLKDQGRADNTAYPMTTLGQSLGPPGAHQGFRDWTQNKLAAEPESYGNQIQNPPYT